MRATSKSLSRCEGGVAATKQFGMYSVTLLKSREICPDFLVRTMRLSWEAEGAQESRTVCQFHYSAWPVCIAYYLQSIIIYPKK